MRPSLLVSLLLAALVASAASLPAAAAHLPGSRTSRSLSGLPTQTIANPSPAAPSSPSAADIAAEEEARRRTTPSPTLAPPPPTTTTTPPASSPPSPPPPTATSTPWLPACANPRVGLASYTVIASPASSVAASSSSASSTASSAKAPPPTTKNMTSADFFAASPASKTVPKPMPLPMVPLPSSSNNSVSSAAACSSDAAYSTSASARAAPSVCMLISCFNGGSSCYTCSGTFIADPAGQGRLLFLTASHCAALTSTNAMHLPSSYVNCNRNGGALSTSDGVFRTSAAAISNIDFSRGYGVADGAAILLTPLSNTNVAAYAVPVAVGAVTSTALGSGVAVPTYSAGFPQVIPSLQGCTSAVLGDTQSLHYARSSAYARVLTSNGIAIDGVPGCGGNSGGALMDEGACVLYGVLSATLVNCGAAANGQPINTNFYSRIVVPGSGVAGVPLQALVSALNVGSAVFV